MHITSKDFLILVIIGPSGCGKSTVVRQLHQKGRVAIIPTWTTRPPRPDEFMYQIEHRFISTAEFKAKEKAGFFLETKQMFNLPYYYGLPRVIKPKLGHVPLIILRASVITLFSKHYPNYIIYQIEDSLPRVRKRLMERKIFGDKLGSRLENYEKEVVIGRKLANRVFINDKAEKLAQKLEKSIIKDFAKSIDFIQVSQIT